MEGLAGGMRAARLLGGVLHGISQMTQIQK